MNTVVAVDPIANLGKRRYLSKAGATQIDNGYRPPATDCPECHSKAEPVRENIGPGSRWARLRTDRFILVCPDCGAGREDES